ncbi:MAG TPA: hypothetical protein VF463_10710 [Sphingobium sp.]
MTAPIICAAHACSEIVVRGQLMCKPHWLALPKPIRDEVWDSWRAYQPSAVRGLDGMEIARRGMRYMAAVRAAREYTVGAAPLTNRMREEQIAFRSQRQSADGALSAEKPILETVEAFLQQTAMPPTRFGREAARDSRIVFDMRAGRKLSDRVCRRLRHFMVTYRREIAL